MPNSKSRFDGVCRGNLRIRGITRSSVGKQQTAQIRQSVTHLRAHEYALNALDRIRKRVFYFKHIAQMQWPMGFFKCVQLVKYQHLRHLRSSNFIEHPLNLLNLLQVIGISCVHYV